MTKHTPKMIDKIDDLTNLLSETRDRAPTNPRCLALTTIKSDLVCIYLTDDDLKSIDGPAIQRLADGDANTNFALSTPPRKLAAGLIVGGLV
ncbi:hypothetical protein [Sulfitobacter sp. W074]|uniref:hypothetical protein n=1 Tax=Sulfitobacter sp. W074 TaxID=2867026 RepID=UPI0021A89708|nr:hypothetical protein [Sulfitobacter sp. W074]UWR38374.1 hypothetical protein K3762_04905 [Sulfitobacter sp. W074]